MVNKLPKLRGKMPKTTTTTKTVKWQSRSQKNPHLTVKTMGTTLEKVKKERKSKDTGWFAESRRKSAAWEGHHCDPRGPHACLSWVDENRRFLHRHGRAAGAKAMWASNATRRGANAVPGSCQCRATRQCKATPRKYSILLRFLFFPLSFYPDVRHAPRLTRPATEHSTKLTKTKQGKLVHNLMLGAFYRISGRPWSCVVNTIMLERLSQFIKPQLPIMSGEQLRGY